MDEVVRLSDVNKDIVDISAMTEEERKQVQTIADGIKIDDSNAIISYGVGAQREISDFADTILQEVRSKDTGFVGEIMTDLVVTIKDLDVDSLGSGGGFFSKIPLVGNFLDAFKRFVARYDKMSVQLEKIVEELDKARMNLLRDITLLDNLYERNLGFLKNLDLYIAAGQIKLREMREKMVPELKAKADASGDPADAQRLQDFMQFLNRFEKKLHDLKLSRMVSIQTAPQVRLVQSGNQVLVEKIQSSILNTIPLWKNQIVLAITLFRQKKAVELQKEVSETTNELLRKNMEMLKSSTLDIARESERGIVDIETLKKVNNDLISTIEETLKIQKEGRAKRELAEKELVKLEGELKQKLVDIKE